MRIVYTSDLHGNKELYAELFATALRKEAQTVIIGGDMLPHYGPFKYSLKDQEEFILNYLEPKLRDFLVEAPQANLYAMLGNDDWRVSNTHLRSLSKKGLLRMLHGEKHEAEDGHELIGYAHVPPTPFTIKDGERRDLRGDPVRRQRCTACCSQGAKIFAVDPIQYFAGVESIEEELEGLPKPKDFRKTVYVMHSPPYKTSLDRLIDGRWVGSRAIRAFIERHSPYLTLHGHIHESSEISGSYLDRIGETICINPGQSTEELYGVVFELGDVPGTIEHTVFGTMAQGELSDAS
jgi:Icc-related predicted phosphoesterase